MRGRLVEQGMSTGAVGAGDRSRAQPTPYLQQPGQLGVPVGHVPLLVQVSTPLSDLAEGADHVAKRQQALQQTHVGQ